MLTKDEMRFLHDIVDSYSDILERYCRRSLNNIPDRDYLAQDIVQTVFLNAIFNVDKLMKHENVIGWLKKACQHRIIDEIRRRSCRPELLLPPEKVSTHVEAGQFDRSIALQDIFEAVTEVLSQEEQDIFIDIFINGYSVKETASFHKARYTSLYTKVSSIRKKIQKYFSAFPILLIVIRYIR